MTVINGKIKISPYQKKVDSSRQKKIIKGWVAHPGKVKGKVRIGTPYTFHQLQPGEVVVTSMTTPDAITFLRRVAVIVTDEGGITCHAAIVAREMKKPCVIGTKIATQVLKDGDWAEVDAERGIVKKVLK